MKNIRKGIYGYEMPQEHKNHFIEVYENHNSEIIDYFNRNELNLHILCWEWGFEWIQLCSVLKIPVPDFPFPHMNKQVYEKNNNNNSI